MSGSCFLCGSRAESQRVYRMKKAVAFLLILSFCFSFVCCSEEEEKDDRIEDILFLGDDLMETSKVYEYYEELCRLNHNEVNIHHMTIEDARMYTYADMCEEDKEFRALVKNADVILFEEGSAETVTTVESVTKILSYADDPLVICISYYGYPRWMHRNIFLNSHPDFRYADSNTVIGSIIALDDAPLGFEHLYHEDYIHPNELNGFIVSLICYSKTFDKDPCEIAWRGIENREELLVPSLCSDKDELYDLLLKLQELTDDYIN